MIDFLSSLVAAIVAVLPAASTVVPDSAFAEATACAGDRTDSGSQLEL
jgi:hypothetical protein